MVKEYKTDATIRLTGLRSGSPLDLNVTLDKRPPPANELPKYEEETFEFTNVESSEDKNIEEKPVKESQKIDLEKDEKKELSDSEDTVSTASSIAGGYEIYYHTNKKTNQKKKYLKKQDGKKTHLFKYVKDIESIEDPVGQVVNKGGVEKASFYRKKKN